MLFIQSIKTKGSKCLTICCLLVLFTSCKDQISIKGFEKDRWINAPSDCSNYRLEIASAIVDQKEALLTSNQNEIEAFLGKADEHELYNRNQKFFHYRLDPPATCGTKNVFPEYLSIRFNAIGRASEVQKIIRENQ